MPDGIWSPQADPIAGAMNNGAQWAIQSAHVGIQRDYLQQAKEQHDEQKRQFDYNVQDQMGKEWQDILMEPNQNLRVRRGLAFKEKYDNAGYPVKDTWIESLKDMEVSIPNQKAYLQKFYNLSPEAAQAVQDKYESDMNIFGRDYANKELEKGYSHLTALETAKIKAVSTQQTQLLRGTKGALQQYNQDVGPTKTMIEGLTRVDDIFRAIDANQITNTKQLSGLIQDKIKQTEMGYSRLPEGSYEKSQMGSKISILKDLLQQYSGIPQEATPKEFMKQLKSLTATFKQSYADQYEAREQSIIEGYKAVGLNQEANVVKSASEAFKRMHGQKLGMFGYSRGTPKTNTAPPPDPKERAALVQQLKDAISDPNTPAPDRAAAEAELKRIGEK